MCKISNEIKFCSCNREPFHTLKNSWIISRRQEGWMVIGEAVFNENELKIEETEIKILENNLNSKNMFDFEYNPEEDDQLKIQLNYKDQYSTYYFKYQNNRWNYYIELDWLNSRQPPYIEEFSGKIENPFK